MNNTTTTAANISLNDIQDAVAKAKYEFPIDKIEKIEISPKLYLYLQGYYDFIAIREETEIYSLYGVPCEVNLTLNDFNYKIIRKGE